MIDNTILLRANQSFRNVIWSSIAFWFMFFKESAFLRQLFVYNVFLFYGKLSVTYQLDFKTTNAAQFDKG